MTDTSNDGVRRIRTREELIEVAREIAAGDWHEPDEQDITASVHGRNFDNAGTWPLGQIRRTGSPDPDDQHLAGIPDPQPTPCHAEIYVTLHVKNKPVAHVNLATLFLWATGLCGHVAPEGCRADPEAGGGQADG